MTTNHVEKLDPALKRYGRFTAKINLTRMKAIHAHSLIKYHYPEYNNEINIPDNIITPATLTSYIMSSSNLIQLEKLIVEHDYDNI
jgi:ATP-dependent 26S proteasome regulatory subunit